MIIRQVSQFLIHGYATFSLNPFIPQRTIEETDFCRQAKFFRDDISYFMHKNFWY